MIREYVEDDFERVTEFWHAASRIAMPALEARMAHTLEQARHYFRDVVCSKNKIWVLVQRDEPLAFLAMSEDFIDYLYVDPRAHRRGHGTQLLRHAKQLSPRHLWLYTHQANAVARSFYETNGFTAARFGISPAPELEPDVEYHWRPRA